MYVKKGSTGNGSSWTNAIGEVADALKYAKQNENQWTATNTLQIWVAAGTYHPLYDPADNNFGNVPTAANARDVSFLLVNNVKLYGGFAGTETNLATRNWNTNKTILSGDLGTLNNFTDNAYNVVLAIGKSATEPISANTILDGFTITGGNANHTFTRIICGQTIERMYGGGFHNLFANTTLTNIVISENKAIHGGGIRSLLSSQTMTNSIISENTADIDGGGLYNYAGHGIYTNVTLTNNGSNGFFAFGWTYWNNSINWDNINGANYESSHSLIKRNNSSQNGNISAVNITENDIFVDFANGNYQLKSSAVAINSGSNALYNALTNPPATDLAGNLRIFGGIIDLGAYESQCITPAPTGNAAQTFCNSATVADLVATATGIQWYAAATGGTPLALTTPLANGTTYYATQTVSGCESATRFAVIVTIVNNSCSNWNSRTDFL